MPAHDGSSRPLDDVIDGQRVAMLVTSSAEGLTARPVTILDIHGDVFGFLVDRTTPWALDVAGGATDVLLAFAGPHANRWVSLSGRARLLDDRATLERLWSPEIGAFFDGVDDPTLVALEVEVTGGEWWEGPSGRLGRAIAMVFRDDEDKPGEHGSVELD